MSVTTVNSIADATVISAAASVQSKLDLLTARLRRDVWLYGVLAVTATAAGVLLLTIVSDAVFQPESTGVRFAVWIPVLVAGAVAVYLFVWHPLRERCNALAIAWSLEEQNPELQETLTSTLLLAESKQPGSASLIDAVAALADQRLADCRDAAATRLDLRIPGLAAASCVVIAVICFAGWPQYLLPALSNVLAPWKARQLPYLAATISPGHIAVAEGEALEVSASGSDLDGSVLEIMADNTVLSETPMTAVASGDEASVFLPGFSTDQTYRIRSGSLVSDVYRITVHPRPIVTHAEAVVQFPEYSGMEPVTIDDLSVPISALAGTRVRISIASLTSVSEARLTLGDKQQDAARSVQIEDLWWHHWNLQIDDQTEQVGFVELISDHGVPSEPLAVEIQSIPDNPPEVFIKTPSLQHLTVQPDTRLPISFAAADDFGLQSVEVLIQTEHAETERALLLQDPGASKHASEYIFQPLEHNLQAGDRRVLWFVATDNRTPEYGGAQTTESHRLMITVADDAVSVGGQQVIDEQTRILAALTDALDRLHESHETAQQIVAATQQADSNREDGLPADTNPDAQKLQQQLQDASQALENQAASNNDDAALFETEKQQIRSIANEEVAEARHQARMIPLTSDPAEQQKAATAARAAIEQAEEKLMALKEQLKNRAEKLQRAAELDELARQQNELAGRMQEQEQPPQQVEQHQQKIADKLQELVEDNPEAKAEQFLQRADTAEQLAERTTQLQEQQQQLTSVSESESDEETRRRLTRMILKEQEALAAENRELLEEARKHEGNPAQEDAAAEAQQLMEQVTNDLAEQDLKAAKRNAEDAQRKLQEAAAPQDADDGTQQRQPQVSQEKRDRLAERQERIEQAILAVEADDFEAAKNDLQKLITDRVEQVAEEAEELLELPTDDEENQNAGDEAKQKLQEALDHTKKASAKPWEQEPGNASNPEAKQQSGQQDEKAGESQTKQRGDQKNDPAAKQIEAGQQGADPKQREEAEQQKTEQQAEQQPGQLDQKNERPQAQRRGEQKKDQAEEQAEAGQKDQPKQQAKAKQKQSEQQAQQQKPPGQQEKAAQSLKQASQSLQQFCKSCRKCANCNKPGQSGSASNGASRSGDKRPGQSGDKQPGDKQSGDKQSGDKQSGQSDQKTSATTKQLAKTTDKAQTAARNPTPNAAKQLAKELDELADDAAQNSNYPLRQRSKAESSRENNGSLKTQQGADGKDGSSAGRSPSGVPAGVGRNTKPEDVGMVATQLRGPSTSEWTRGHKRLRGNVLDEKSTQIPEAYRGVVEDYFEQLSRMESNEQKSEASK